MKLRLVWGYWLTRYASRTGASSSSDSFGRRRLEAPRPRRIQRQSPERRLAKRAVHHRAERDERASDRRIDGRHHGVEEVVDAPEKQDDREPGGRREEWSRPKARANAPQQEQGAHCDQR